ncbi:MAG: hypothetical protein ACRC10_09745 [Thermoguttaceae bacterium]
MEFPALTKLRKFAPISFILLLSLLCGCLCGCSVECLKPGVAVRSDWSLELNRNKPTKSRKKDDSGHHSPCGRTGCLRCALAPKTVEGSEETSSEAPQMFPNPLVMYPPPYPAAPFPGMMPPLPYPGPIPQPTVMIAVIDPRTGQRSVMQPVLPGMPGILMQNAMTGQPVMVNPYPAPNQGPNAPFYPPSPAQSFQPGPGGTSFPSPVAQMPYIANPGMNPALMPVQGAFPPNPAMMTGQAYAGSTANAGFPNPQESTNSANSTNSAKSAPKSSMPYPKYHGVPTKPVFQRTEGLATEEAVENEEKARLRQLGKALGTSIPEGTKIAPNGINQQLLPDSGRTGGNPANGLPFSLGEKLGLGGKSSKPTPMTAQEKSLRELQEQQEVQLQMVELENEFGGIQGLRQRPKKSGFLANSLLSPASQEVKSERLAVELARHENVGVSQIRNIMVTESEEMPIAEMILEEPFVAIADSVEIEKTVQPAQPSKQVQPNKRSIRRVNETSEIGGSEIAGKGGEVSGQKAATKPLKQVVGTQKESVKPLQSQTLPQTLPIPVFPPVLPDSPSPALLQDLEGENEDQGVEEESPSDLIGFAEETEIGQMVVQAGKQTQPLSHVAPEPGQTPTKSPTVSPVHPQTRSRVAPRPAKPYLGSKM